MKNTLTAVESQQHKGSERTKVPVLRWFQGNAARDTSNEKKDGYQKRQELARQQHESQLKLADRLSGIAQGKE